MDEDFSEQFITDMVNTEIYLIPMLNTDGHRYDMEEYCGETAWRTATGAVGGRTYETTPTPESHRFPMSTNLLIQVATAST